MIEETKIYRCGTLTYTKPALVVLFFWLIWGDICYTLVEAVTGPIMQFKFHDDLHVADKNMALLLGFIPSMVYMFFNPIVSFKSDRFRSRWGRRIPFLAVSVPLLVLGLIGLAFGQRLGVYVYNFGEHAANWRGVIWLSRWLPFLSHSFQVNTVVMWTYGVLMLVFTLFNTFTTTAFWYLFNDVVPEHLLARFMSWFRVVSVLALAGYNFFVFRFSGSHSTEIFLGAAALYAVGFGLMCWNVREGEYPPPAPNVGGGTGPLSIIATFGKECHSNKIYWYLWLCTFIGCIGGGVGIFDNVFKENAIGLSKGQIGNINGANLILISMMVVGAGWLADRIEAIRVVLISQILSWIILVPTSMIWLFWHPAPSETWVFHLNFLQHIPYMHAYSTVELQKVFVVSFIIYVGLTAPVASLGSMWDPVMMMRTFPRSRLGQFCSMNAIWRTAGTQAGGVMVGFCFDWLRHRLGGGDHVYFYSPVWSAIFGAPAFVFFVLFYREWKRLGGATSYVAPVPGEDDGSPVAPLEVTV